METKPKITIPFVNELLRNQITQAIHEFLILQLHVFRPEKSSSAEVFILMQTPKDAATLRTRNWLTRAAETDQVNIHVSSYQEAEYQLKHGNPFYQYYANPSTIVWTTEDLPSPLKVHPTKKTYKKKLNIFKEKFYHDHDILLTEAHKFHARQMFASTFQTYLTIFEHHTAYLENLYTGWVSSDKNLHLRLKKMMRYIPQLQKVFVLKNQETFYLINKMEKSVKEAEDGGASDNSLELYGAIQVAEKTLYKMVADRFSDFRNIIDFRRVPCLLPNVAYASTSKDLLFDNAVDIITKKLAPEEIFLFHTRETTSADSPEKQYIYYLLLIGEKIGNTAIRDLQLSIRNFFAEKVNVVILGHSRIFIQEHLYKYQRFMQRIITNENRVYRSSTILPSIHWQDEELDNDLDFDMCYSTVKGFAAQYFNLRNHLENGNHYGLVQLFAQCVMRLWRVYIYGALPFYIPNFLNAYTIWKLCVYADPSFEKMEFLFEKLTPDFYKFIDHYIKYADTYGNSTMEELTIMDEILTLLLQNLEKQVKD